MIHQLVSSPVLLSLTNLSILTILSPEVKTKNGIDTSISAAERGCGGITDLFQTEIEFAITVGTYGV